MASNFCIIELKITTETREIGEAVELGVELKKLVYPKVKGLELELFITPPILEPDELKEVFKSAIAKSYTPTKEEVDLDNALRMVMTTLAQQADEADEDQIDADAAEEAIFDENIANSERVQFSKEVDQFCNIINSDLAEREEARRVAEREEAVISEFLARDNAE